MHDLRKKVLVQSGKTQSRKARAKEDPRPRSSDPSEDKKSPGSSTHGSPLSSRAGSRNNSRPASRYASEDEWDDDEVVGTALSEVAVDLDEFDDTTEWMTRLSNRISQLQERKRNLSERETTLVSYLYLIRNNYTLDQIVGSLDNSIFPALVSSIEKGGSEKEVLAAFNALSVTLLTHPSPKIFDRISRKLRVVCEESQSEQVKVAAMNALAISLLFEGGGQPDMEDILEFLLEIVESDGQTVNAEDSGAVVIGALQAWGCIASYVENLVEATEDGRAMEAFLEQLDSTDARVQVSAGYNIAQIFEAAKILKRDVGLQRSQHLALTRMHEIVKYWTKSTSKKDRRLIRDELPPIITSIQRGVGPGYVEKGESLVSMGFDDGSAAGTWLGDNSRVTLHTKDREGKTVGDWKCHARLEVLRKVLAGGLDEHWRVNPVVQSTLHSVRRQDYLDSDSEEDDDEEDGDSEEDDSDY